MTLLVSAMAARVPAPGVTPGEGPGQQIGRDGEKAEQLEFALPKVRGLRALWFLFNIVAIVLQVNDKMQVISERENRTLLVDSLNLRGKGHLSRRI